MRLLSRLALAAAVALAALPAMAQDFIAGIPRNETLILQGPGAQNADWFNLWAPGGGASPNGLQQLTGDTFWFINPEGTGDSAWTNALASERPIYNDDFTQMTVKLREGIYWSDGVEFTSADVKYTVETQIEHPGMGWSAPLRQREERRGARSNDGRVNLNAPTRGSIRCLRCAGTLPGFCPSTSSRRSTIRWLSPQPAYVAERLRASQLRSGGPVGDLEAPRRLGAHLDRHDLDEAPAVKYVVYRTAGNPDARVIEQMNHNLDVINDIAPEGMFTIARQAAETTTQWLPGFPFAHPDPTLPSVLLNTKKAPFDNPDVRWALALMIDIRAVSMGSYRGAANLAALSTPPTGTAIPDYYAPMQEWLNNFTLDTGARTIQPYDGTIAEQIAALVRPQWGDSVPTDPDQLKAMFGFGWWKYDPGAAAELLTKAGFTKDGSKWLKPDGTPFTIVLNIEGDNIPTLARAGSIIAQSWANEGIDAKVNVTGPTHWQLMNAGDFDASIAWTVETWGGHPDLSFFLESYHSDYIKPLGENQPPRNLTRWEHPKLDEIIEANRTVGFDDPKVTELGMDYLKLAVEEMPFIPLMAYNKFAPFDTTYWTGYPSIDNPYSASGPFWSNLRYMIVALKPNPNAPQ